MPFVCSSNKRSLLRYIRYSEKHHTRIQLEDNNLDSEYYSIFPHINLHQIDKLYWNSNKLEWLDHSKFHYRHFDQQYKRICQRDTCMMNRYRENHQHSNNFEGLVSSRDFHHKYFVLNCRPQLHSDKIQYNGFHLQENRHQILDYNKSLHKHSH